MTCIVAIDLYWATGSSDFSRFTPLCRHLILLHGIHLSTAVSPHDTLEPVLEPLDCLLLVDTMASTNLALGTSSLGYSLTRSCPVYSSLSIPSKSHEGPNTFSPAETHMQQ